MKNYDRVTPRVPEGVAERAAHIVGGGIAGLSAAAFLVRDGHMPGGNITIYDQLPVFGGSMDSAGDAVNGYVSRGERELEPYMECLWDLMASVPSLDDPSRSVLDETRQTNQELEINSAHRLWNQGFVAHDQSTLGISPAVARQMASMMTTPESKLGDITIEQWFDPDYFDSALWFYWASMLAFQPYHSLIEMKRYTVRFMQHLDGIEHLKGILRTKQDQYTSLILPLQKYLVDHGVQFMPNTTVVDLKFDFEGDRKTVTALVLDRDGSVVSTPVNPRDLVIVTNGSMTQNSTQGTMTQSPGVNRDLVHRGCFSLWERLAETSEVFGRPEKFVSDIDKTLFVSFTLTVRDYPELFEYIEAKTGNPTGTGGATTFVDDPWLMSFNAPLQPAFPNQPDNVQVLWGYGLRSNELGSFVDKPMTECNGEEILRQFLFNCGLAEDIEQILPHCTLIPTMLPYITSQFMPRAAGDRPNIIPEGCTNLAMIGQFVELEGDVVFTVETSVRTAMIAVYQMLELDRPITPLFPAQYDIRIIVACLKKLMGVKSFSVRNVPMINPVKIPGLLKSALQAVNSVPTMGDYYPERHENRLPWRQ